MATLYAAKGQSSTTSDLYTLDPATAAPTSVGPIGFAVTGLAFDPTTGILYGLTSSNSAPNPASIITIDPITGAGTFVASIRPIANDNVGATCSDIAVDASGQMFGISTNRGGLVSIDKATGSSVRLSAFFPDFGGGLDFDSAGMLWWISGRTNVWNNVDMSTGAADYVTSLPSPGAGDGTPAAAKFDSAGILWLADSFNPAATRLYKLDPATDFGTDPCTETFVGDIGTKFDAICWTLAPSGPNFSFTLTPSTLTIAEGASDTSALTTIPSGGDTESIALSATGQPAGVTIVFSANPIIAGGGSTITVSVGGAVATGTYPITIHAVGTLNTHTRVLTLNVSGGMQTCSSATLLTPNCTSLTIDNSSYLTTPLASDPLFTVWGQSPNAPAVQFTKQRWFKLPNPSSVQKYAHFTMTNPASSGNIGISVALYIDCPPTTAITCLTADTDTYSDVLHSSGFLGPSASNELTVGVTVPPGSTAYIEIAGDRPFGVPAWDGPLTLSWGLFNATFYDTTDTYVAASLAVPDRTDCGLSETFPINTGLDVSGMLNTTVIANDPNSLSTPLDYINALDSHWIVAGSDKFSDSPGPFGPDHYISQLGVWKIDPTTGAQTFIDAVRLDYYTCNQKDYGESFFAIGFGFYFIPRARFATDGTNLWLVAMTRVSRPIFWDASIPKHLWMVEIPLVYHWNGSSFDYIGEVDGTCGGMSPFIGQFDCCASPAQPGVLHVVFSEAGSTTNHNSSADCSNVSKYGYFGCAGNPDGAAYVTRLAYASFSTSARTSQFDIGTSFTDDCVGFPIFSPIDPHFYASQYFWVRNDSGSPIFAWIPASITSSPGYQPKAEIYSISGGAATLAATIDSAFLSAAVPGHTITSIDSGLMTRNLQADIGFDGRDVYFLLLKGTTSPALGVSVTLRIEPANLGTPRYFDDDPALSPGGGILDLTLGASVIPPSATASCDLKGTWISWEQGHLAHFNRCDHHHGWGQLGLSGASIYTPYPDLVNTLTGSFFGDDDFIYYGGTYEDGTAGGFGYLNFLSLNRTRIIRDHFVCDVGECVSSEGLHIWSRIALR